jgi:hypothetical protein
MAQCLPLKHLEYIYYFLIKENLHELKTKIQFLFFKMMNKFQMFIIDTAD